MPFKRENCASLLPKVVYSYLPKTVQCYLPITKVLEIYKYYDRNVQISVEKDNSGMSDNCIMLEAFNSRQYFELDCCGP